MLGLLFQLQINVFPCSQIYLSLKTIMAAFKRPLSNSFKFQLQINGMPKCKQLPLSRKSYQSTWALDVTNVWRAESNLYSFHWFLSVFTAEKGFSFIQFSAHLASCIDIYCKKHIISSTVNSKSSFTLRERKKRAKRTIQCDSVWVPWRILRRYHVINCELIQYNLLFAIALFWLCAEIFIRCALHAHFVMLAAQELW